MLRAGPRAETAALPSALEDLARSMRSGSSVEVALAEVALTASPPVQAELQACVDLLGRGASLAGALGSWSATTAVPGVRLAVAALLLAHEGGSRAWALDQVAATLRERLALDQELRAQASQATLSAAVIVLAPVGFSALMVLVDPRVAGFLASPVGIGCVGLGLTLDAAGAWWMRRLLRSVGC
jgi:tight adherence protein B